MFYLFDMSPMAYEAINTLPKKNGISLKASALIEPLKKTLLAALFIVPSVSLQAQDRDDFEDPFHPLNPTSPMSPLNQTSPLSPFYNNYSHAADLTTMDQKTIDLNTISFRKLDSSALGISTEKLQQIDKEFDAFFATVISGEKNFDWPQLLGEFSKIAGKHNLSPAQQQYVFTHYVDDVANWSDYNTFLSKIKNNYTEEQVNQKMQEIFSYKWGLSMKDLIKEKFPELAWCPLAFRLPFWIFCFVCAIFLWLYGYMIIKYGGK